MKTIVVISTRGFGAFRHDLLVDAENTRFIGIFSEFDAENITQGQRDYLEQVHVIPCGKANPTPAECSLVDFQAACELIEGLLRDPATTELSLHSFDERNLLLAAELRAHFGLAGPRYDAILPFRDKCLMKEKLIAAGVRAPAFGRYDIEAAQANPAEYFRAITDAVGLPFILKPVDGNSADGVFKISSWEDYAAVPAELGRHYEYEEFILGTMYSVNFVSKDRRAVFGGVTEYLVNSTEVQNGRVNVDINLIDADPRVARMLAFGESALAALGWPDGASHLELFLTAEDELVFLEVAARFKGLAGLAAMQQHYGVALVNLALELEAGLKSHPYPVDQQVYCFDGVMPKKQGIVDTLVEPAIESEFSMAWKVRPGDVIGQGSSLSDNAGTFLVWNTDYEALYRDFERLADYQPITYTHGSNA
ncbi:ATP-grasp domain-containing protein [Catellatospora sichuanensis]|uniref:ATP-grasp domain-containing protein n=1 Tax=Catellatospora sichuanensis TaxID=1969805 RepID=UPI0016426360|nr:ATP-grasp domain-containing protein [Catellatospora sichuanensis]